MLMAGRRLPQYSRLQSEFEEFKKSNYFEQQSGPCRSSPSQVFVNCENSSSTIICLCICSPKSGTTYQSEIIESFLYRIVSFKIGNLLYIIFCCQPLLYSYVLLYNTMYRCTVYIQALSCLLYLCTCILYTYWLFHACFTSLCICVLCTGIL